MATRGTVLRRFISYLLSSTLLFAQLPLAGCAAHKQVHEEHDHPGYVVCPKCGQSFEIKTHRRAKALSVTEGAVGFGAVGVVVGGGLGGLIGGLMMAPTIVFIPSGIIGGMAIGAAAGGTVGGASGGVAVAKHQASALQCPYCGAIFDIAKL